MNLRIVDQYISDIEDFSNSHEIQSIKEVPQSFLSRLENCNFDDVVEFESINFNNENTVKKIKKNQIDKEIFLTVEDIYANKIQTKRFEFPNLNKNEIIEKFTKFLNENSNVREIKAEYFECDSIEDPRISSSASVDKNVRMASSDLDFLDLKTHETRALSFYNILVEASEGLITVFQNGPFENIEIHGPTGIHYFI